MSSSTMTPKTSKTNRQAFTFMEMFVVMALVGLIAGLSYSLMLAAKPEYDTRTASLQLESILVKAQNMAVNQQKHTRVVVNCARVAGNKNCFADIESAVYDEYSVAGWEKRLEDREVLKPEIRVVKARPSATHSAKEEDMSETDVFWAIFMPSRHVFSEPQGFRLFIYHNSQPEPRKDGWRLTVNSLSGQVQLSRDSLTPKV